MAVQLGTFGSVFRYGESYYVYFAITPEGDRIFAARILDEEYTADLQRLAAKHEKRPDSRLSGSLNLCFVILSTDDFKGQAASFVGTGSNVGPDDGIELTGRSLNEADVAELKEIILEDKAMPGVLVKLIQEMDSKQ